MFFKCITFILCGYRAQQTFSHQNNECVNTFQSDYTLKKNKDKPKHLLTHIQQQSTISLKASQLNAFQSFSFNSALKYYFRHTGECFKLVCGSLKYRGILPLPFLPLPQLPPKLPLGVSMKTQFLSLMEGRRN